MLNLIFILITLALLAGFFALADYEARRGIRLLAQYRNNLDSIVERTKFILEHVNLGEFIGGEIRHMASNIGHDIVHFSLVAVRSIERALTSLVRRLRTRRETGAAPRETAREFVKTLSDFKNGLKAAHPEDF